MSTANIPQTVRNRKRYAFLANLFIGLSLLLAFLHFFTLGVSNLLWPFCGCIATLCTQQLRQSVRHVDTAAADMDEYELQLHYEAQQDGLRWALILTLALFGIAGALACLLRFTDFAHIADAESTSNFNVAIFFAKLIYIEMLWVPFIVAQSVAGKFNRDELISKES